MAPQQLVADRGDDIGEREIPGLVRDLRVERDLQQQVAEFVAQVRMIAAVDRIDDLVGLLDRARRNRLERLLDIPRAAMLAVAQAADDANFFYIGYPYIVSPLPGSPDEDDAIKAAAAKK